MINKRLNTLRKIYSALEKEVSIPASEDILLCRKTRGHDRYYINGIYKPKDKYIKQITALANEEYWRNLFPKLKKEIRILERSIRADRELEEVYEKLHEGKRKLVTPFFRSVSEIIEQFEKEEYVGLEFDENDATEYYSNKGERVRSKTEKIIADELLRKGIPYKYEKPLILNANSKPITIYPDFTAVNVRTGKIRYIEHLGMIDNSNYYKNTLLKLDTFERNGLLIGKDVLLFHESSYSPINTKVIDYYIEEFLT